MDDYHAERMAEYEERLARLSQRYTFGEAAMRFALDEARRAADEGEVPVGAIVRDRKSSSSERRTTCRSAFTIRLLMRKSWRFARLPPRFVQYRLTEASLYVTLEPCVMCVGAIVNARITQGLLWCARREGGRTRFGL